MIINRHNYEAFFLMYVDDELTAAERVEVELFAQQNPDLAPELDMLLQTKLSADDTMLFMHKDTLLQNADAISVDNYEEQFLLYIDNELDKDKKEAVEKFVLQQPQFQDEFTLLKQTVLEPEPIVFEDKASLLRKEERRRVVPMYIRFAAAAAIAGIALVIWWMQPGTSSNADIAVAKNDTIKNSIAGKKQDDTNSSLPGTTITAQKPEKERTASVKTQPVKENKSSAILANKEKKNTEKNNVAAVNKTSTINPGANNTTAAIRKPDATHDNETAAGVEVTVNNNTTDNEVAVNIQHANDNGRPGSDINNETGFVKNALYKELNTDVEDERNSLYVGSMQINKNKVRGLVKKVGGLFAGKSKDAAREDGKLQIANLELNTN
jgi:hypothetical protein